MSKLRQIVKSLLWINSIIWLTAISPPVYQSCADAFEKIPVAVTILPQAYFVERLGGDHVDVKVMIPRGASPETYEPTPRQLVGLSNARLYVNIGLDAFPAEKKFINALKNKASAMEIVDFSGTAVLLKDDPHVWLSPAAVKGLSRSICQALIKIDSHRKDYFRKNLQIFLKDIENMELRIRNMLAGKKGKPFLVHHPAWGYFAAEFGLRQLSIEEEGKTVSAHDIKKIIEIAKSMGIDVIFVQKGFDAKVARSVSREIGGRIVEVDPLEKDWLKNLQKFAELLRDTIK